jgi:hypothetical protein
VVERRVLERQRLGVADDPLHLEPLAVRAPPAGIDLHRGKIDGSDTRTPPRGRHRHVAVARGEIEDPVARSDAGGRHQILRRRHEPPGQPRVVALAVERALLRLDRLRIDHRTILPGTSRRGQAPRAV